MKQIDSIAGKCYIATAPNGGTVTDEAGRTLATVEAGEQKAVWGTDGKLYLSDDEGKLVLATFNHALAALGLLGGGDKLPAGYRKLDFLESTGSQCINTEYSGGCTANFRYAILEASAYNAASSCWGQSDALDNSRGSVWAATNTGYLNLYACFNVGDAYVKGQFYDITHELCDNNSIIALTVNGVRKHAGAYGTYNPTSYNLFNRSNRQARERLGYCSISSAGKLVRDFVPALDPAGEPCMFDRVSKKPFRNSGSGSFIAGVGSVAQLTGLLRNLPASGGTLTLSLPAEANTPEMAEALQACHDTKGWTLTVREYRPAAASTYSLRRVREVVWCRREQSDLGSYVDSAGYRWQIDRCVAIFGRLGNDPTAYGYTPFDSVDDAAAHWELVPYVDPNAEELSTIEA